MAAKKRKTTGRKPPLPPKPLGRPTKCTPEIAAKIASLVESGVPGKTAAGSVGLAKSSFSLWMAKGRAGDPDYSDFSDLIERARCRVQVKVIRLLFGKGAKAKPFEFAKWFLSVRARDEWADKPPPSVAEVTDDLFARLSKKFDAETVAAIVDAIADDGGEEEESVGAD